MWRLSLANMLRLESRRSKITRAKGGKSLDVSPLHFQALDAEGMDMEIDLSNLGIVNAMIAALFSKLDVPIKITVFANILEEALNGTVTIKLLPIGTSVNGKVEKQFSHFYSVRIDEEQAESGIVVRVMSPSQSKFKLLYFEQDANGGYGLALQEINFFKHAFYIIEALYAKSYEDTTHNLKDVEANILRKRNELRQFEAEYRKVFLLK